MPWLIYRHISPSGKSYIGQTSKSTWKERAGVNGTGYGCGRKGHPTPFGYAIQKYGWENFTHEVLEENIPTQELADKRERYWIKYYNSLAKNGNGYNTEIGGIYCPRYEREIYQIDRNTLQIVRKFDSILKAKEEMDYSSTSLISRVCTGERPQYDGYYWAYADEYDKGEWQFRTNKLYSPVYQIDMTTLNIVGQYKGPKDAAESMGYKGEGGRKGIQRCCQRLRYSYKDYFWCYQKEYSFDWKPAEELKIPKPRKRKENKYNWQHYIGEKFGKLEVVSYVGARRDSNIIKHYFYFRCDCGKTVEKPIEYVRASNGAKSCGCARFGRRKNSYLKEGDK